MEGVWASGDNTDFQISGWTTDTDNSIKVYTTSLARHNGKWNETKYRRELHSTWDIREEYVWTDGLQFRSTATTGDAVIIYAPIYTFNSDIKISNNIIWGNVSGGVNSIVGIRGNYGGIGNYYIWNNVLYDFIGGAAINDDAISVNIGNYYIYNNTIFNTEIGIIKALSGGSLIANNNIIASTTDPFWGTFATGTQNNATDKNDTPTGGSNTYINQTFSFVSTASGTEDFHLLETDAGARNKGVDLSATTTLSFSTDIDGGARNVDGAGWDIGADEVATKIYRSIGNISTAISNAATVSISSSTRLATFSAGQPDNVGVGDVIQFGNSGYYDVAFITGRTSSSTFSVQSWNGGVPSATTSAAMNIYRAHLEMDDWEDQVIGDVNTGINSTVREKVLVGQNLVASGTIMMAACYSAATVDDAAVTIDGWTTGEGNYVKIYTPYKLDEVGVSQRHAGVWDGNKYNISRNTGQNSGIIYIIDDNIYIDGLQIYNSTTSGEYVYGILSQYSRNNLNISNNIIKAYKNSTCTNHYGLYLVGSGYSVTNSRAWNNVVYNWNQAGIASQDSTNKIYSNTVYGNGLGIGGSWSVSSFMNNISVGNTLDYSDHLIGSNSNNISADATAPGTNSKTNTTVNFVDAVNDNFHLSPTDTAAIDAGTSSVSSLFTDDIDGHYRRQWDIGADEASIDFDSTVMQSGGIFSSLSSWESANQVDLTATTTAVFSISFASGTIPIGGSVTGATSGATASTTVVATSSNKILLYNIVGTFQSGEQVRLTSATGNYVTISNLGNPANAVAKIDGAWTAADTNAVTIDGWTTGVNNYIRIYTTASARHAGKWDDGKYRISRNQDCVILYERDVVIDGLQISVNIASDLRYGIRSVSSADVNAFNHKYKNNIIRSTGNSVGYGISLTGISQAFGNIYIYNNIIYGWDTYAIYLGNANLNYYVNNDTFYDNGNGVWHGNGTQYLFNNIAQNCTTNCFSSIGGISASLANNISSDGTAPGINSKINTNVSFVDSANYDFHLATEDTVARDAGTSSPMSYGSDAYYDIDGNPRYDGVWDIGADEGTTILYRSVGNDTSNFAPAGTKVTVTATNTNNAIFSANLPANVGVGDILQIGTSTYQMLVIHGRTSSSTYSVRTWNGAVPTATYATSSAPVAVYRAHRYLDDWEDQVAGDVNASISSTIENQVLVGQNLVASNTAMFVPCYASTSPDNLAVDVDGWTTGTSSYIKIYTPVEVSEVGVRQRHEGVWDDEKYRIEYGGQILNVKNSNVRIDGLQIFDNNNGIGTRGIYYREFNESGINYITNNISRGAIVSSTTMISKGIQIYNTGSSSSFYIINNIVYDWGPKGYTDGISVGSSSNIYIYNNTIYNSQSGINNANSTPAHNVIVKNNTVFGNYDDFDGIDVLDYNASDDGNGTNPIDISPAMRGTEEEAWGAVFTDYANGDFSIRDIYSPLYNSGTAITSVTDDIVGTIRPYYESYDIGAFEYDSRKPKYRFYGDFKLKGRFEFK